MIVTFLIISTLLLIGSFIWFKIESNREMGYIHIVQVLIPLFLSATILTLILSISQFFVLKQENIRQTKEREHIEYQIELYNDGEISDSIKLNEWILTYNDWVNDINTKKEAYGWWSWYHSFDMTNHTYIKLV